MKIGSLFDGSGGFPISAQEQGITPVWASEIEPFPILVTSARFPNMKHYGDLCALVGSETEAVDVISGGSPCQDMSVAGKRRGMLQVCPFCGAEFDIQSDMDACILCGAEMGKTRSGLFIEQIRIIKEMRAKSNGKQPRIMLWENVPGALSSNNGEDFRAVLEETARVKAPDTCIPRPEGGKWKNSGAIVADGWSVAWRILDAQFWGVAQRRRRIFLVADFGGQSAPEILFERDGLSRYLAKSNSEGQTTSGKTSDSLGAASSDGRLSEIETLCFEPGAMSRLGGYVNSDLCSTLRAEMGDNQPAVLTENIVYSFDSLASNSMKSSNPFSGCREVDTAKCLDTSIPDPSKNQGGIAVLREAIPIQDKATRHSGGGPTRNNDGAGNGLGIGNEGDPMYTLSCGDKHAAAFNMLQDPVSETDKTPCLSSGNSKTGQASIAIAIENHPADSRMKFSEDGNIQTLTSRMGTGGGNVPLVMETNPVFCTTTGGFMQVEEDKTSTLMVGDYKDPQVVAYYEADLHNYKEGNCGTLKASGGCLRRGSETMLVNNSYLVRRLTPDECRKLQGFPQGWCAGIAIEYPTEEDIAKWAEIFETHRKIIGESEKPKSRKQIIKWLKNPYNDGAEYKMWGNGVAKPCVDYVMEGIAKVLRAAETQDLLD